MDKFGFVTGGAMRVAPDLRAPVLVPEEAIPMKSALIAVTLPVALLAAAACAAELPGYQKDIRPILERNCVVCHACYDAPCQLKMESPEGLERGATKVAIYRRRVGDQEPTRLLVDAASTAEWRRKGFFPVIEGGASSLLARMLELGAKRPGPPGEPVPAAIKLGLDRENQCPTASEFDTYRHRRMHEGMPFGMAPLSAAELATLRAWLAAGAPLDAPVAAGDTAAVRSAVARWEAFLNRKSPRQRLLSRYLYEHLFLAHLVLDATAPGQFHEMVRASTPSGTPIQVIPTRRPTDDPGDDFYYRLRPVHGSIVQKNHIPYPFGSDKLTHIQDLFAREEWTVEELPPYQRNGATNPFQAFAAIPGRLKYQFLLDDAHFFVQCFIRGPVCLGQIATDVIEDHFFALFQSPASDRFITDADYRKLQAPDLDLDGREGFSLDVVPGWMRAEMRYTKRRGQAYAKAPGTSWDDVWHGDGSNPDALLTIFRNFDNATVIRGLKGRAPETLWLLDYPLFERIYYLLVANFDVFGSTAHQLTTRFYFDLLRAEAETNFLRFMPKDSRRALRESWYRGPLATLKSRSVYADVDQETPTLIPQGGGDPRESFVQQALSRMAALARGADDLTGACDARLEGTGTAGARGEIEHALRELAVGEAASRPFMQQLPELVFVRVVVDGAAGDLAYTLIRNRAHQSVAFMLGESNRLEPEKDYLTLLRGPVGCYPNFMFRVPRKEVTSFTAELLAARGPRKFRALVHRFGVRRTHPSFWDDFRFFRDYQTRVDPMGAGIFDANRYANY